MRFCYLHNINEMKKEKKKNLNFINIYSKVNVIQAVLFSLIRFDLMALTLSFNNFLYKMRPKHKKYRKNISFFFFFLKQKE